MTFDKENPRFLVQLFFITRRKLLNLCDPLSMANEAEIFSHEQSILCIVTNNNTDRRLSADEPAQTLHAANGISIHTQLIVHQGYELSLNSK